MWTTTTYVQHMRDGLRFASDVTDGKCTVPEPLPPPTSPVGQRPMWSLRELVNAIFYVLRGGISWRMLPPCFQPRRPSMGGSVPGETQAFGSQLTVV